MAVLHQIQQGTVELTPGSTEIRFDMPDGKQMFVRITGTEDARVMAAYAHLFSNLPFLLREPLAYIHMVGQKCDVELL